MSSLEITLVALVRGRLAAAAGWPERSQRINNDDDDDDEDAVKVGKELKTIRSRESAAARDLIIFFSSTREPTRDEFVCKSNNVIAIIRKFMGRWRNSKISLS